MNHVEKTPGFESQKISWEAGEKTYTKNSKEPVKHYNFLPFLRHYDSPPLFWCFMDSLENPDDDHAYPSSLKAKQFSNFQDLLIFQTLFTTQNKISTRRPENAFLLNMHCGQHFFCPKMSQQVLICKNFLLGWPEFLDSG